MPVLSFPDPREAGTEGLVAIGGDLHPKTLLLAYRSGIFPWPVDEIDPDTGKPYPLTWFSPPERAILERSRLHIPRSLALARKKSKFKFTWDRAFDQVISHCERAFRPGQSGTWITPGMRTAYQEFHRLGHAHSIEVWDGEELVGGLYGVDVDGAFAGESMFHLRPNASKLALLEVMDRFAERGLDWIDIQMLTPHLEALGARLIPRDGFLDRLAETRAKGLILFEVGARRTN